MSEHTVAPSQDIIITQEGPSQRAYWMRQMIIYGLLLVGAAMV